MRHHSCRPPPSPAVLTHTRPSPTVPHRPHLFPGVPGRPLPSLPILGRPRASPAVLTHHRPSSIVPGRPSPLPCTNISHPVGPAVLPKDGRPALMADGTDYSLPSIPSGALGSPPAGPRRAPGRLRTLPASTAIYRNFANARRCSLVRRLSLGSCSGRAPPLARQHVAPTHGAQTQV